VLPSAFLSKMGSGASGVAGGLSKAAQAATDEELKATFLALPEAEQKKILNAMLSVTGGRQVTLDVLQKQDSETSQTILEVYAADPLFQKVSARLCTEIMNRDKEDGEKLGKGIQMAVDKNVLPKDVQVEPTTKVSVTGKTADAVAAEIITALGDAPSKGCVMVLQGLSGTGKGTTVAKLSEKLPNAQTWSNGNIFRSLTVLAVTWSEKEGKELKDALTPERLSEFCTMLEFGKFDGSSKFDVKIEGLGLRYLVSEVEKTVLKDSKFAKNLPTVAEVTQGEVIKFVSGALAKMAEAGINVLVEGRAQTLDHIRTPHRFELVLDDTSIVGKRQAALQIGGKAWAAVKDKNPDQAAVDAAIKSAIAELAV